MTTDAWITLIVLVGTFGVLATERLPAVAGMGAAVGVLLLTGVVDQSEALSGFSSSAPMTIAALYVLAGAATVTGALTPVIDRLMAGRSNGASHRGADRWRLARLCVSATAMSAVLPNSPLVALTAPRVVTWCRRAGVSASTYLMPLSYAAVLGGVVTVIGTSTNLVVSDLLVAGGGEALGIFEITGAGLPVALAGVVVLVLSAPRLLGDRGIDVADRSASPGTFTLALRVVADGPVAGCTVQDAGLRSLQGVFLAGVERSGQLVTARPETMLGPGDICYFAGDVDDVVDLLETSGLESAELAHVAGTGDRPDAGLYEVVVSERQWRGHGDFSVIASRDTSPPPRRDRAWMVLVAIVGMIALAVTNVLDLMESSLLAAVALVVFRVISVNEARRAVNLNVVLTIAL